LYHGILSNESTGSHADWDWALGSILLCPVVTPNTAQLLVLRFPILHLTLAIAVPNSLTLAASLRRARFAASETSSLFLVNGYQLLSQIIIEISVEGRHGGFNL
jgi:hypothetical protein